MQRLLSVMPGVRRTGEDREGHEWSEYGNVPAWIPSGTYPQRIMAPEAWDPAVKRVPADIVTERPTDWIIVDGELEGLAEETKLSLALVRLFDLLHRRGGHLVFRIDTSLDPKVDVVAERLVAPFEWWMQRIESVADLRGFDTRWLWSSMARFQLLRRRAYHEAEQAELAAWDLPNVLLVEMTPRKPRKEPTEKKPWWKWWRR